MGGAVATWCGSQGVVARVVQVPRIDIVYQAEDENRKYKIKGSHGANNECPEAVVTNGSEENCDLSMAAVGILFISHKTDKIS